VRKGQNFVLTRKICVTRRIDHWRPRDGSRGQLPGVVLERCDRASLGLGRAPRSRAHAERCRAILAAADQAPASDSRQVGKARTQPGRSRKVDLSDTAAFRPSKLLPEPLTEGEVAQAVGSALALTLPAACRARVDDGPSHSVRRRATGEPPRAFAVAADEETITLADGEPLDQESSSSPSSFTAAGGYGARSRCLLRDPACGGGPPGKAYGHETTARSVLAAAGRRLLWS